MEDFLRGWRGLCDVLYWQQEGLPHYPKHLRWMLRSPTRVGSRCGSAGVEARGNHSGFTLHGAASLMRAGAGWWLLIFWICIGG